MSARFVFTDISNHFMQRSVWTVNKSSEKQTDRQTKSELNFQFGIAFTNLYQIYFVSLKPATGESASPTSK